MPEGREGAVAIEAFAGRLRELKDGTSHSFESLARRIGVSRSTLHRYCQGKGVPGEFATVERFARACKADRAVLTELHRLWVLADEEYRRGDVPAPAGATAGEDVQPSPEPARVPDPGPVAAITPQPAAPPQDQAPDPGPDPATDAAAGSRRSRRWLVAGTAAALIALAGAFVLWDRDGPSGESSAGKQADDRPLFSGVCDEPLAMGRHDGCVEELQKLLVERGLPLVVDAQYGPETLRRVTAFQVLSDLPVNGVVGNETKHALYESDLRVTTWSEKEITDRIREVFPGEAGDQAVLISRCQSRLDPFYVLANENGTRNWGLFQLTDFRVRQAGGTTLDAFDPEFNIQAAYQLWSQNEDFRDWPFCLPALDNPQNQDEEEQSGDEDAGEEPAEDQP
ncbi:helix-turn-helix domain-containing protein [Streptomyces xiamenensis]|uniref:helix-turn-helix domain-containing protein n=1 Tax=Streptomyces xiamenensis TaxID=408015 RepID=UPI003412E037